MPPTREYQRWRAIMDEGSQNPVVSCKAHAHWRKKLEDNKEKLVVAYFSADWCGPCRFIYPILADLAEKNKDRALFVKIDVDESQAIAQAWRVDAMPTFVLIRNKAEVDRVVGARKEDLKVAVAKHLPPPPNSTQRI